MSFEVSLNQHRYLCICRAETLMCPKLLTIGGTLLLNCINSAFFFFFFSPATVQKIAAELIFTVCEQPEYSLVKTIKRVAPHLWEACVNIYRASVFMMFNQRRLH